MPRPADIFQPPSFNTQNPPVASGIPTSFIQGSSTPPFAAGNLPLAVTPSQSPSPTTTARTSEFIIGMSPLAQPFLSQTAISTGNSSFGAASITLAPVASTPQAATKPAFTNGQVLPPPPAPLYAPGLLAASGVASKLSAAAAFAEKITSQSHQTLIPRNLLGGTGPAGVHSLLPSSDLGMTLADGHTPQTTPGIRPEMGQVTLVAPPMHVASPEAEQAGMATAFDWPTLAKGAGVLDAGGLARLQSVLPEGAEAIYPALPAGSAGTSAINLPLAPSLLSSLLSQAYGPAAPGIAAQAAGMADAATGGAAPATPLDARLVPGKRPMGGQAGLLHTGVAQKTGQAGALEKRAAGRQHAAEYWISSGCRSA